MRISFDYQIDNVNDFKAVSEVIENMIESNDCHISNANLYLSIKDDNEEPYVFVNENDDKVKYTVKNKMYSNTKQSPYYIISDLKHNKKLYIYEGIDNT